MNRALEMVDGAHFVAVMWCLSPVIPFALLVSDENVPWMPYAGAVVLLLFGFSVTKLRAQRKKEGQWKYSDVAAYIAIPVGLFAIATLAALGSVAT